MGGHGSGVVASGGGSGAATAASSGGGGSEGEGRASADVAAERRGGLDGQGEDQEDSGERGDGEGIGQVDCHVQLFGEWMILLSMLWTKFGSGAIIVTGEVNTR